ncbi:MAG: cobyrinate a,c-diamide synthase [Zetaproteobacteria bacterium]|nr:MAG: cobyrinate a,c-diamide synthase [Zetaproteobacteria bacterium]
MVAGTHSGCGKTTVTLALMCWFRQRGLTIAPFKAGPDFLDPMHLAHVADRPCYNLDTWMVGRQESRILLHRQSGDADVAVVEGVMGLFDGQQGVGGPGSSADLACLLRLPVWLVIDAGGMAGTVAPLVAGLVEECVRQSVRVAGIIANRAGGEGHARMLAGFLRERHLPPLIGWLGHAKDCLAERYLGLVPPDKERGPKYPTFQPLVDPLLLSDALPTIANQAQGGGRRRLKGLHIAIAQDEAFRFLYPANLDWLREQGAALSFFSPIAGESIPQADALWLPGGYPELYAESLSRSRTLRSISAFCDSGRPVLAECGGMMVLGRCIVDVEGRQYPMAGVSTHRYCMRPRLVDLGYRQTWDGLRGHAFHYAQREGEGRDAPAYELVQDGDQGWRYKGVRASWNHWYFPSAPETAAGLFQ